LTAGALSWREAALRPPAASGLALPGAQTALAKTVAFRITLASGAYTLAWGPRGWAMPERDGYSVKPEAVAALAQGLEQLRLTAERTSDPERLDTLGLADPRAGGTGALVELLDGAGVAQAGLIVGVRPSGTYVRRLGETKAYAVDRGLPPLQDPAAWLDLKILEMAEEAVARVDVIPLSGPPFAVVRAADGAFQPLGRTDFSRANATAAATALTRWRPVDVRSTSRLPDGPFARHMTTSRGGMAVLAEAQSVDGRTWVRLRAQALRPEAQEAADALNARAQGWAFALAAYDAADYLFTDADMAPRGGAP
jgi:hypothetical protein